MRELGIDHLPEAGKVAMCKQHEITRVYVVRAKTVFFFGIVICLCCIYHSHTLAQLAEEEASCDRGKCHLHHSRLLVLASISFMSQRQDTSRSLTLSRLIT